MAASNSLKIQVYRQSAPEEPIAQVELNAADMLSVIAATEGARAEIEAFVQRANAKPTVAMEVTPPPDAERYQLHRRAVERGEPEFFTALRGFAKTYFELLLGGDDVKDPRHIAQQAAAGKSPPSEFQIDLLATPE